MPGENENLPQGSGDSVEEIVTLCSEEDKNNKQGEETQQKDEERAGKKSTTDTDQLKEEEGGDDGEKEKRVQNDENNNHLHNQVVENNAVDHNQSPQDVKMYENQVYEESNEINENQEVIDQPNEQNMEDLENEQNDQPLESTLNDEAENAVEFEQNGQENQEQDVEQIENAADEYEDEEQDEMELVMEMDSGGEDQDDCGVGEKQGQGQGDEGDDAPKSMDVDDDQDEEIIQLDEEDNNDVDNEMQVDEEYTFQDNQGDELLDEELNDQKQKHIAGHDFDGDVELDYEDYDETEHQQNDNAVQPKQQQQVTEKQQQPNEKQDKNKVDEYKSKQRRSAETRKRAYSPIPLPTPSSSAPAKEVLPGGIKISRKGDHVRTVRPLSGHQVEKMKFSLPLGNLESNLPSKMQRKPLSRSKRDKLSRKLSGRSVWQMREFPKNQDIRVKIWQDDDNSTYLQTARSKLIIDPCEQDEKYDEGLRTAQRVLTMQTIQHLQYGVVRRVRAQVFRELTAKDTSKMRDPNPYVLAMARKIGEQRKIGLDEIQKDKYYDLGCCRLMSLVSKQLQQKLNKISKSKRYEVIREFGSLDCGMVTDVPDWWLIGFMLDRAEKEIVEELPVRDGPRLIPEEMRKEIEELRRQLRIKQQQKASAAAPPTKPGSTSIPPGSGQGQQSGKGGRPQDIPSSSKAPSSKMQPPPPSSKSLSNEKVKIPGRNQPIVDSSKKREPILPPKIAPQSSKGPPPRGSQPAGRGMQPPPPRTPVEPPKMRVVQSGGSRGGGLPHDLRVSSSGRQPMNPNESSREREKDARSRGRGGGRSRSPPRGVEPPYPPARPISPPRRRVEKRRDRSMSPPKLARRKVERQEDVQARLGSRSRRSPPRARSGRRSRSRSPRRRPNDNWLAEIGGRGGSGAGEVRGGPMYGYGTQPSSQPMKSNVAPGFSISDLQNGMQQQFNQGRTSMQQPPAPNNNNTNLLLQQLQQQLQPLGLDQATMNSILALATQQQQQQQPQMQNSMQPSQQQQQQQFMQNNQQMGQFSQIQAQLQNQTPQQQQNILQNILNAATKNQPASNSNNPAPGFGVGVSSQNLMSGGLNGSSQQQQQQQFPPFSSSGNLNNTNISSQIQPQQTQSSGTQVRVVVGGTRAADPVRQKWQHDSLRKDNEDAFKIGRFAFGVADGLGGTAVEQGVSSAGYALEMVDLSVQGLEEMAVSAYQNSQDFPNLRTAIEFAYAQNRKSGATTICLLALDCLRAMLHVARVGDSGYVVLRPLQNSEDMLIVSPWKPYQDSTDHIRGLNTTTYLASPDLQPRISGVNPNRAAKTNIQVRSGDIVIAATDGFFDAVFLHGKEGQSMRQRIRKRAVAQQCDPGLLAEELAATALQVSMAHVRKDCPYNLESRRRKEGRELKADDVAIVVAYVLQA